MQLASGFRRNGLASVSAMRENKRMKTGSLEMVLDWANVNWAGGAFSSLALRLPKASCCREMQERAVGSQ